MNSLSPQISHHLNSIELFPIQHPYFIYAMYLKQIDGVDFTAREVDIISCLVGGRSVKISSFLAISPKTVGTHIGNILQKIRGNSREDIIDFAEKSSNYFFIKKYYQSLLIHNSFENFLINNLTARIKQNLLLEKELSFKGFTKEWTVIIKDLLKHLNLIDIHVTFLPERDFLNIDLSILDRPVLVTLSPENLVKMLKKTKGCFYAIPNFIKYSEDKKDNSYQLIHDLVKLNIHEDSNISDKTLETMVIFYPTVNSSPQNACASPLLDSTMHPFVREKDMSKAVYVLIEGDNYYDQILNLLKNLLPDRTTIGELSVEFLNKAQKIWEGDTVFIENSSLVTQLTNRNKSYTINFLHNIFKNKLNVNVINKKISIKKTASNLILMIFFLVFIYFTLFHFSKMPIQSFVDWKRDPSLVCSDLSLPIDTCFLKRPSLMKLMEEKLTNNNPIRTIALMGIVGMGGVGKTTLARHYAKLHPASVVWELNAETKQSLINSFKDLAYALAKSKQEKEELVFILEIPNEERKEKQLLTFIKKNLKTNNNWLLFFDNVENHKDIQDYLPKDSYQWGSGRVILTTRDKNIQNTNFIEKEKVIAIDELTKEEALILFTKILYQKEVCELPSHIKNETLTFLKDIPPFPLDVSVAAYYMEGAKLTYPKYRERVKQYSQDFDEVQKTFMKDISTYSKTRYGILTSSFDKLISINPEFTKLLLFIFLLDSQNIPKDLLEIYKGGIITDDFLHNLKKYSLITDCSVGCKREKGIRNDDESIAFSIHRSTQQIGLIYILQRINKENKEKIVGDIVNTLEKYLDIFIDKEDKNNMKKMIIHCYSFLNQDIEFPHQNKSSLYKKLGLIYNYLGEYKKSILPLEKSIELLKKNYQENYEEIANIYTIIGNTYRDIGIYNKSKENFNKALHIYENKHIKDKKNMILFYIYISHFYRNLGNYSQSEFLAKKGENISECLFGKNNILTARCRVMLSYTYLDMGKYKEAKEICEQAVDIYTNHYAENHTRISWLYLMLGDSYRGLGELSKAKKFLEKSLIIQTLNHGADQIDTAWVMAYLGRIYKEIGNYEKARNFLEKSFKLYKAFFCEDHIEIGWISSLLGSFYLATNEHDKAKTCFQYSLLTYKNHYGITHKRTLDILEELEKIKQASNK